ncbi:MAG: class I SAM-dependent methyltransferase [Planctomycetota bacterium]|nr:class I SAM-dependent methyltransferase [Planctomycetota bacterium]
MESKPHGKFTFECEDITPALRASSPAGRNQLWKNWYDKLISQLGNSEYRFINYGYMAQEKLELDPAEQDRRNFIELYQQTLGDTDLTGKDVLDVSSGLGGGALWISRRHRPASLVAMDLSTEAVNLCNEWYSDQRNLRFVVGNSESLPFPDSSFDVIYNVESAHCYTNFGAFLQEVQRVLRPDGVFCWSDFQNRDSMDSLRLQFSSAGFTTVNFEDITDGVIRSLEYVRCGISDGSLDSNLFIWGGDTDGIQGVIEEFRDWRSYHCCQISMDSSARSSR